VTLTVRPTSAQHCRFKPASQSERNRMAQCCERPRFHHYQHSRTVLDSIMYVLGTDVDMFDGPPTVKQQTYA
jgi:hypothetical protein